MVNCGKNITLTYHQNDNNYYCLSVKIPISTHLRAIIKFQSFFFNTIGSRLYIQTIVEKLRSHSSEEAHLVFIKQGSQIGACASAELP